MAKHDPALTTRNLRINELSAQLDALRPQVLALTGYKDLYSLHGKIGGKNAQYIDIKHVVVTSEEHFIYLWLEGFVKHIVSHESGSGAHADTYQLLRTHVPFRHYLYLFLARTYLRNYDALSRKRPHVTESEIWIGQKNAEYGLLITPRFRNGRWENDESEIRHVEFDYWTIGHILRTGLAIPNRPQYLPFSNVEAYLQFFCEVVVRASGSPYEYEIACRYRDYVNQSADPMKVPLLIPELRYGGLAAKHEHRLDFCVIDPVNLTKIGIELSPWSTHGQLKKIGELTQKAINALAQANFEKEMKKLKDYFWQFGIYTLIFTDQDLTNCAGIFQQIAKFLVPKQKMTQLSFHMLEEFFR